MASHEEIRTVLAEIRKASPAQMFQSIDASNAGMRAILIYLGDTDQVVTASMVSEFMNVSTARVAVLLKKMEAKGLIKKERDHQDNRKIQIALSEQGRQLAAQVHDNIDRQVGAMIDQIGMERMLEFAEIAKEMHSIFQPADIDV